MNTTVSSELNHELLCRIAVSCMNFQNKGVFDAYLETGKTAVKEQGAMIFEVYSKLKQSKKWS